MKIRMSLLTVGAVIVLLAGCTSAPASDADAAPSEETPAVTATPTPTPKLLSTEEAAAAYLTLICPSNAAGMPLSAAWAAEDPAALAAAATAKQVVDREAALALDDPMTIWPSDVSEDIGVVRDELLGALVTLDSLSRVTTMEDAYAVQGPPHSEASQRIRLRLGLPTNTSEGCPA